MPKAILTRREQFNAAHRLFKEEFTDEENFEVYGKCSNPNWHGHNYTLWVSVEGEVNPSTGFIVNLKELSRIIKDSVIEKLDHKNINIEVDFMKGVMPSAENLAIYIWNELEPLVKEIGVSLYSVKIQETENNTAEYFGN